MEKLDCRDTAEKLTDLLVKLYCNPNATPRRHMYRQDADKILEFLDSKTYGATCEEGPKPPPGKVPETLKVDYLTVTRGHVWKLHTDGTVDMLAHESDFHNGPRCVICGYIFCHHCHDGPEEDCPGLPPGKVIVVLKADNGDVTQIIRDA